MLSKVTLGEEHLSCDMAMAIQGCDDKEVKDHHCCDNQYTTVTTDDNFAKANFNINFQQLVSLAVVSVFVFQQVVEPQTRVDNYALYRPPPLFKNIPVLYETFLI